MSNSNNEVNELTKDAYADSNEMFNVDKLLGTDIFGRREIQLPVYSKVTPYTAKVQPNYVFDNDSLTAIVNFLANPLGDALYLFGPSGCGKTSAINQVAALFGWPIVQMTLNGRFEVADLIGHPTICGEQVVFVHGPLARAMKYGYILILNEIDLADPSELAGLNDVIEGRALVVVQNNGEVIEPHPNFRLVVTANTRGTGDGNAYCGTQMLNMAFLDRFRFIACSYMRTSVEAELLHRSFPILTEDFCLALVRVANEIRDSHLNYSTKHIYITVPMSTRALMRWAGLVCCYKDAMHPVDLALDQAFCSRISEDESTFVHRLYRDVSGEKMKIFA